MQTMAAIGRASESEAGDTSVESYNINVNILLLQTATALSSISEYSISLQLTAPRI